MIYEIDLPQQRPHLAVIIIIIIIINITGTNIAHALEGFPPSFHERRSQLFPRRRIAELEQDVRCSAESGIGIQVPAERFVVFLLGGFDVCF